ncbi:uncharacterized protein LOC111330577, partial [Stylophora pistillata]|uniref:uncharacterized protein LOC111330577 n=1 Tax=Stylophora pistillata TaxID=50429 RepID=UPI000C045A98
MKIDQELRFIVVEKQASSLYSLIADGIYRATLPGRDKWKKLIGSRASLQLNCNMEGFNVKASNLGYSKARIGIVTNDESDCVSCNSRIRFGTGGRPGYSNTCGIEASVKGPDN